MCKQLIICRLDCKNANSGCACTAGLLNQLIQEFWGSMRSIYEINFTDHSRIHRSFVTKVLGYKDDI